MSIDTFEEADTVFTAAREATRRGDHAVAHELLLDLYASTVFEPEWSTAVRYHLGEACFMLDDFDAAARFHKEAKDGVGDFAKASEARLKEIAELQSAQAAAADGVSGKAESDLVMREAWDLYLAHNYDAAIELYLKAYDDTDLPKETSARIAFDIGRCYLNLAKYDLAKQWLEYAMLIGSPKTDGEAKAVLASIEAHERAVNDAADGARAGELPQLSRAAKSAIERGDAAAAASLQLAILQHPALRPEERGFTLFNLGQAYLRLRQYDEARAAYEQAIQTGADRPAALSAERIDLLDRLREALDITDAEALDDALESAGQRRLDEEGG